MTEARSRARPSQHAGKDVQYPGIAAALLLAVVTAFGLHMIVSAPAIHRAADAALARIIANEDRDVCGQFGLRAGTTSFAACSRELANVRQKQSDRDQAAAAGIL